MLPVRLSVLTNTAYPVGRQDRHFYFRLLFLEELFSLSRKASNAITRLPKAHNNVSMPRKIERISKAVIGATVYASLRSSLIGCPPDIQRPSMYSGKPVIGVGRLPLRSASVGVKQASTGRLTPCHGYFPMAFAMLLIYHFSCHNSTIFVNSFVLIFSYFITVCYAFLSFTIS